MPRICRVGSVNKDSARQGHEPSQEGCAPQGLLGRDGAVFWEDIAEHQHVQLGLVIANEDSRPCFVEIVVRILDFKGDAGCQPHHVFEASRSRPLRDSAIADQAQKYGYRDAIASADNERNVGCEKAGKKAGSGDSYGEHIEDEDKPHVAGRQEAKIVSNCGHVWYGSHGS